MSDTDRITPSEFSSAFRRFLDAMNAEAAKETSPLLDRLRTHLGGEPGRMPIITEDFDSYEHPNVQVALDRVLYSNGRSSDLVGIAAQNKRFGQFTFSDLLAMSGPWGRLAEGPVDYVNFHLEDDKTIPCVQFGLYLVTQGEDRLTVFVVGPPAAEMGPRTRLRVEVACARREVAAALLREFTAATKELNVYRGKAISLAPGVVEDVDLIAQERGLPGQQTSPILFDLLNQLDGLADDADVLFILTTNRPDILEPALAARPGRVDLVAELPIPDAAGRARLLELYARGLTLADVDFARYVEKTDGASPAYIKELLRKAALLAAIGGSRSVTPEHLDAAMKELEAGGELAKRIVGFGTSAYLPPAPSVGPMRPAGFPTTVEVRRPS